MGKRTLFCLGIVISTMMTVICNGQCRPGDEILGKWMMAEGTLIIDVYREGCDFKARIAWFRDHDNVAIPMAARVDKRNPDKSLRNRKIIGMELVKNLKYNIKSNRWEHGIIYDATSGREWDSAAWLTNKGLLKVRGYWGFEFMGKTITFKKV